MFFISCRRLHAAKQALLSKTCDYAFVGACNMIDDVIFAIDPTGRWGFYRNPCIIMLLAAEAMVLFREKGESLS